MNCSLIGRGSSSLGVRGNESANEWFPSPGILGDEILDVHEDNEEHVEHVVGSSQNQVGSNVTPSSSLPKLWLVGGVFYDPAISRHAVRLFKTMFKGTYATWTKVPQDHHDRYSDIMRGVRKVAMKHMVNVWDTDEWRLKSKVSKENKDKSQSRKHTAGSHSFLHTKIVMEKKKGRKVKLVKLHTEVHIKNRLSQESPDQIILEKNKENEENTEIDENGFKSPPDDFEVWKGVGTSNRGRVLGAGFTIDPAFMLTGKRKPRKGQNRVKTGKNRKRVEAGKSLKQLQWVEQEKLKKTQK
nr:hypothetical protein [Tanacetum cinerariifolium]